LREPVAIDLCSDLRNAKVNVVTDRPQRLDTILESLASQTGSRLRLFIGEHGEVARPTFFCGSRAGHLITLGK